MPKFWVVVALAASVTSCSRPTAPPPDRRPPLGYALSAAGLPTEGIWKSTPALVDINRDGSLDLAALPRLGQGARVWLGNGKGGWAEASLGLEMPVSCGGGVTVGDVNKDPHLDLVVADHCEGVFVYLGDSQGHWNASTKKALNPRVSQARSRPEDEDDPFLGAEDVALGDVNEDGFLDLVAAAANEGGFSVHLGGGSRNTWKEVTVSDGLPSAQDPEPGDEERAGWANKVLLTDIDADGHLDVVASYYRGPRVWRGDGTGRWQSSSSGLATPITGGLYRALAVGDVNEDGRVDLVVANTSGGPEAYLQRSDGTWERSPSTALSSLVGGADSLALGDLDGDGHLDLVIGGRRTRAGQSDLVTVGRGTRGGESDLVTLGRRGRGGEGGPGGLGALGGLFVFLGNGKAGWVEVEQTGLPTEGYQYIWGITLGDVNGDSRLDLAVGTGANAGARLAPTKQGEPIQPGRTAEGRPQLQVWVNNGQRGS